jgi:hypothetical protein
MITFAALGDVHGQINRAAALIREAEEKLGERFRFILQVGDLEAYRTSADLATLYAPLREKKLHDFPQYDAGEQIFPRPMYFIGGNHESYGFLEEEARGMTLAPNFHYLGRTGMKNIEGLRVTFLSGGYDPDVFEHGRQSAIPSDIQDEDWESQYQLACFTREDLASLKTYSRPDVFLVHVWPFGLVRKEDHEDGEPAHRKLRYQESGVRAVRDLIEIVKPKLVLCGHRHRRYQGWIGNHSGAKTRVQCLGEVRQGEEGLAVYRFAEGQIREVGL